MVAGPDETLKIFCAALQGVIASDPEQTPEQIVDRAGKITKLATGVFEALDLD